MNRRVIRAARDVTIEGTDVKRGEDIAEVVSGGLGSNRLRIPKGASYDAANVESMLCVRWATEHQIDDVPGNGAPKTQRTEDSKARPNVGRRDPTNSNGGRVGRNK